MSLRVGEVGKTIRVNCGFDLSSNTQLTLVFTKPSGATATKTKADGITAPVVDAIEYEDDGTTVVQTFTANEYMEYDTESGLLDESGIWSVRAQYDDATPKTFIGDTTTFTVLPTA